MKINVKLFAVARQLAGADSIQVELPDPATVADLRAALIAAVPPLANLSNHLMFAVNTDYAGEEAIIPADAEVACIPPVSGG